MIVILAQSVLIWKIAASVLLSNSCKQMGLLWQLFFIRELKSIGSLQIKLSAWTMSPDRKKKKQQPCLSARTFHKSWNNQAGSWSNLWICHKSIFLKTALAKGIVMTLK